MTTQISVDHSMQDGPDMTIVHQEDLTVPLNRGGVQQQCSYK